jgi:O-antigen ligase
MQQSNLSQDNNNVNLNYFFGRTFKNAFLFIVFAELLSLCGYLLPEFNKIAFFVIVLLTLFLALQKLEYGVWIVLAELFIGSKGYLFFFEYNGLIISIRIALWLIVMAVWAGKVVGELIKNRRENRRDLVSTGETKSLRFFRSSYFSYFFILFIFVAWGVTNGFLNHNEFNNIFFDFNGWLYFTLIFPVFYVTRDSKGILQIFTAAIIWLCVKTFFLLFIFSHNITSIVSEIYRWVRVSGVGEITKMQGGFYRIFFQSHVFVLIGFFIFLILLFNKLINNNKLIDSSLFKDKKFWLLLSVVCCLLSVVLISFSRSFWVGLAFGSLVYWFVSLLVYNTGWKKFFIANGVLLAGAILSFALIIITVKFPYPRPIGGFAATELLSERATKITDEAAVSSRWALLPKLWDEIKKSPVTGQGFGKTITYQSSDPRVLQTSPTGEYTTYAFEWGWLDIWLKLGLFGLLAYLILISKIIIRGLKLEAISWELGLAIGLAVVAVVSIFSPYMNHPLGIGYLIIVTAVL